MTPAIFPEPDIGGDRFSCNDATADALSVAQLRDEFARWLRRGAGMDETRMCDTVLAVNEALANAAEFAYDDGRAGLLNLEAVRDVRRGTITVTVSDQGHWRETNSLHLMRSRGRGISLMRTLADSVIIDTSGLGTSVRLRFDDATARTPTAGGVS